MAFRPPSPSQRRKDSIRFAVDDIARTFFDTNPEVAKAKKRFTTEMGKAMKRAGVSANKGITAGIRRVRSS
jgi:hypothetical protein